MAASQPVAFVEKEELVLSARPRTIQCPQGRIFCFRPIAFVRNFNPAHAACAVKKL